MDYARALFVQQVPVGKSGSNLGAHLRQAAKTLGLGADAFEPKGSVPHGLEFVWNAFQHLCSTRQAGFGYLPITFTEMLSWSRLTRVRLYHWQVLVLLKLDSIWLEVRNVKSDSSTDSNSKQ